jgi:type II secretory pathway component PulJ
MTLERLEDERGTTLVELMVGLAMGMVILAGLSMVIITTLHGTSRVTARVEATQRARVAVTKIVEQLHSACTEPRIAPVLSESNGESLVFTHATGEQISAIAPTPTKTTIYLKSGTLWQKNVEPSGATSEIQLLSNVSPVPPSKSIFFYYKYVNGELSHTALPTPLNEEAASVIEVQVALDTLPTNSPVKDAGADLGVQDSAVLRLTPPSFNEAAEALPCQ